MANETKVAGRIKTYRERLGLSVVDLAEKSGIEVDRIAAIESGETLASIGVLTKLSRALGQRLGTFMDDQFKPDPVITRASDLDSGATRPRNGYGYQSLAEGKTDRHMDPFRIVIPADSCAEQSAHEGEELIICISGEVEIKYGDDVSVLKAGDSAYYNSVVKHSLRAIGGDATIYGIVYMPA